jgi:alkyl hydroperoxide reductase subunit D
MTLDELKTALPAYAKDLRLNLESVLSEGGAPGLSMKQIRAVALASAIAARHIPLTRALESFAADQLDATECDGVRAAAAIWSRTRNTRPCARACA